MANEFRVTDEWLEEYYRRRGMTPPSIGHPVIISNPKGEANSLEPSYPITTDVMTMRVDLPPSTNHAYITDKEGRRRISEDGQKYKQNALLITKVFARKQGFGYRKGERVGIWLELHFEAANRDISNCVKLLEDAIAAALGFNDKVVDELHVKAVSRNSDDPHCDVTVRIL